MVSKPQGSRSRRSSRQRCSAKDAALSHRNTKAAAFSQRSAKHAATQNSAHGHRRQDAACAHPGSRSHRSSRQRRNAKDAALSHRSANDAAFSQRSAKDAASTTSTDACQRIPSLDAARKECMHGMHGRKGKCREGNGKGKGSFP